MKSFIKILMLGVLLFSQYNSHAQKAKILFVVTSHQQLGNTGKETGYYLSEVAHPWEVLTNAGYEIDIVSPKGGQAPVDGFDLEDKVNKAVWEDPAFQQKIQHTLKPEAVNVADYVAIHFAGGHGTMWDFPKDKKLAEIAAEIYENGGVVSAVCHGPAGLINIQLNDGRYLVEGKTISTFTNEEEAEMQLEEVVPFALETALIEKGARIDKAENWAEKVSVDGRLVTGQNPASAHLLGEKVVQVLQQN